jgi:sortase A
MTHENDTHHEQHPVSTGRRRSAKGSWLPILQITCAVFGTILLGWYVVARAHSYFASRAAIDQFEEARTARIEVTRHEFEPAEGPPTGPVDTSLWDEGRIEEYRESLFVDMDAPLALLRIPRLEIEVPVFAGTDDLVLNRGVGWIVGTAFPGQAGNTGIAGHRDGFFWPLRDIALGDELVLETTDTSTTYLVEELHIVDPTDVWVLEPTASPSVTLVTCYPFYFVGSAPNRFIVRASTTTDAVP